MSSINCFTLFGYGEFTGAIKMRMNLSSSYFMMTVFFSEFPGFSKTSKSYLIIISVICSAIRNMKWTVSTLFGYGKFIDAIIF